MDTQQLDILVFGAHPDDAEIGMGGTIAKQAAAGQRVGVCDLTLAEMSSNGTVEERQQEAAAATAALGLAYRSNLRLPDRGLLHAGAEAVERMVREIRLTRPRIVFAPYWQDRHPDHVAASHLAEEAVFNAKLRKYMPESGAAHTVQRLYFYFINDVAEPNVAVDVTDVYDSKRAGLLAYKSQFTAPGAGADYVATPLNQGYLERVEARDALLGQRLSASYAEGFASKLPHIVHLF